MRHIYARVVKLVDTLRSGRRVRKGVQVQVLSWARNETKPLLRERLCVSVGDGGLEPPAYRV